MLDVAPIPDEMSVSVPFTENVEDCLNVVPLIRVADVGADPRVVPESEEVDWVLAVSEVKESVAEGVKVSCKLVLEMIVGNAVPLLDVLVNTDPLLDELKPFKLSETEFDVKIVVALERVDTALVGRTAVIKVEVKTSAVHETLVEVVNFAPEIT